MLNEEEEEAAKLKQAEKSQHDNNAEQVENTEHNGTGSIKKKQFFHLLFQTQEEGRKGATQPRKRLHARRKMMTKTVSHNLSWIVMVTHWE